ncbi:MAG TPA: universal stress protein [Methanospirillum sp.]|nr:universal stress protein [Methanospirillum sp.]
MYTKILIGVDGSDESMQALGHGLSLAKILGASVDVLFVIPPRIYTQFADREVITHSPDGQNHHISLLQKEENEIFDAIRAKSSEIGLEVSIHTRVGDAVDGLIEFASSHQIDLIVVGSSGKGMAGRLLLGSVSTGVVHQSMVPVLVVKPA